MSARESIPVPAESQSDVCRVRPRYGILGKKRLIYIEISGTKTPEGRTLLTRTFLFSMKVVLSPTPPPPPHGSRTFLLSTESYDWEDKSAMKRRKVRLREKRFSLVVKSTRKKIVVLFYSQLHFFVPSRIFSLLVEFFFLLVVRVSSQPNFKLPRDSWNY